MNTASLWILSDVGEDVVAIVYGKYQLCQETETHLRWEYPIEMNQKLIDEASTMGLQSLVLNC